jgi:CheY-like chemotaxis protein
MLVLIALGDPDHADSLAAVLQLWGFQTQIPPDGPSALEAALRHHPNAVLVDVGLPGNMDGFELARKLKEMPDFKDVPIAAVTASTDQESRRKSKEAGMVKHFVKPIDLAELHRFLAMSPR